MHTNGYDVRAWRDGVVTSLGRHELVEAMQDG